MENIVAFRLLRLDLGNYRRFCAGGQKKDNSDIKNSFHL